MKTFLNNLLITPGPEVVAGLKTFMGTEEGRRTLPELAALAPDGAVAKGLHKDNLTHSIYVCGNAPARLRLRWAALYHDVGKAQTRVIENGNVTFRGHEALGGKLTRRRLKALGYDPTFIEEVSTLVEVSGRIASFSGEWTASAVRRFAKEVGPLLDDALDLVAADCTSKHESKRLAARRRANDFRAMHLKVMAEDAEAARRPPIDGLRVMQLLGVRPGRIVGEALGWLLANHEHTPPEEAEKALIEWFRSRSDV